MPDIPNNHTALHFFISLEAPGESGSIFACFIKLNFCKFIPKLEMNATVAMMTTQMIQLYAWNWAKGSTEEDEEGDVEVGMSVARWKVKEQAHLLVQLM